MTCSLGEWKKKNHKIESIKGTWTQKGQSMIRPVKFSDVAIVEHRIENNYIKYTSKSRKFENISKTSKRLKNKDHTFKKKQIECPEST